VPAEEAAGYIERLVGAYLAERAAGETFQHYALRKTDEELIAMAGGTDRGQPAAGGEQ